MAAGVHNEDQQQDHSGGEKQVVLNLFPAGAAIHEDSSSAVHHHHQEDHNNINLCGEKRVLLNLFPSTIVEDSSSSSVVIPVAKSIFTMPPNKRLMWEDSLFDDDNGAQVAKSSLFTNYYMPPKKRPFMRRVEEEEEEHSSFDINVRKSAFSLWPKQNLTTFKEKSSVDDNIIVHAAPPPPAVTHTNFPIRKSLTSKEHSSVDTHAPVTRSLCNWQIKKRRTSASSPKKTECLDFANQKEEDDYYALKIQKLIEEMREKYGREKATKKVTKRCRYDVETHRKIKKKKPTDEERDHLETDDHNKIRNLPATNEDQLKRFITGEEINGTDMRLVIQKKLFKSDLKRNQNRLSMPINKLKTNDFLSVEEKRILDDKVNVTSGIEVGLVGPKLEMYEKPMRLKYWEMGNNKNYVLKTNWSDFVDDNKEYLKKERMIRVWSFRKDEQLCFAISVM